MDTLEKVERLRAGANVTYEEALAALEASGDDLLDAMVLLERQGKTAAPGQSVYSTSYRAQDTYIDVPDQVEQQKKAAPSFKGSARKLFHTIIRFVKNTSFSITREGRELFQMPSWVMVLAVLIFWRIAIPAALIAMLFGIRYSFQSDEGSENTDAANSILSKAGDIAGDVAEEFLKGKKDRQKDPEQKDPDR